MTVRHEDLSPELQEKAAACKSPEEILELAKESGYELADEELEQLSISGGWGGAGNNCPRCGSSSHHTIHTGTVDQQNVCNSCGCIWG